MSAGEGMEYYATCHPGLEEVVAQELASSAIGATNIRPGKAGVAFRGDGLATGYAANLWLRAAIRVLVLLAEGELQPRLSGGEQVYRFFRQAAPWPQLLSAGQTFSVEARVRSCTDVPSALLAQIRAKDAICDAMDDAGVGRPAPPPRGQPADLPLYVTMYLDGVRVYRDMSGASLHRRGYRSAMHRASLNEAAAAGLLYLAGWPQFCAQPGAVLADPMCGSGTFLIEGALMATNRAPGLFRRRWPFQGWRDFQSDAWQATLRSARAAGRQWSGSISGNDIHEGALGLALKDARGAGVGELITLYSGPCSSWQPPAKPTLTITNPPWGQRLMADDEDYGDGGPGGGGVQQQAGFGPDGERDSQELQETWYQLGRFFKEQCNESAVCVLSGNKEITQKLRMRADWRKPLVIGGVDCRLLKYTVLPKLPAEVLATS